MATYNNSILYKTLREKYSVFTYKSYHYSIQNNYLICWFDFEINSEMAFHPKTIIPFHADFDYFTKKLPLKDLENIIFQIGMVELISYWKCTCSPTIVIEAANLDDDAISWWKNLYFHGLGEFFYCNQINVDYETYVKIISDSELTFNKQHFNFKNETLVPVGGGKDSAVTLELLKPFYPITPVIINPRGASLSCLEVGGYANNYIKILRTIDPTLLELNKKGFLNGHTPFSAMLAFYSVLIAILTQKKHIALSNESSANESTVKDSDVNHQYSKSYAFETDFRNYIKRYVNDEINYYSFLRPLSEMQIALLFSQFPQYFPVFKSCNSGSKTDSWCCRCPKCLFTFIILSPFIHPEILKKIFGFNLFENNNLIPILNELIGKTDTKPFECVGTREEVCVALCEAEKHYTILPRLLQYFKKTSFYEHYKNYDIRSLLSHYNENHYLDTESFDLLKRIIHNYTEKE